MYDAVFVDPEPKEYPVQPASGEEKNVNPYLKYTHKTIREINITVYDPFGHSVFDTIQKPVNSVQQAGNRLHTKTRRWIIINRLLFKKNDTINALALSETERTLRQTPFINDARIYITETANPDSVDVNVIVHDKWPVTVPFLITDMYAAFRFKNQNLFGVGQQFENYARYGRDQYYNINGFYRIANIDNTYISSQLNWEQSTDGTSLALSFDRGFFSPLSTWAGGVSFSKDWRYYKYTDPVDSLPMQVELNSYSYDVWAGKSFKLNQSHSLFNQSTNIIAGLRFYNTSYIERPPFTIDTLFSNQRTSALIGNLGFAVQQYYKDSYIYRFGATEDVPEGLIVQFIYGGIKKELMKLRYYLGFEIARAKHFDHFGYLSGTFSYGIFFNRFVPNDITTNFRLYYFSNLAKRGEWYFRQFINYSLVHGENKLSNETIGISPDDMYGYDGNALTGNTRMILNAETVAYMPYDLIGFKFAPLIMVGLGMIGDPKHPIVQSRLHQSYSIGLMVRNENLLSSTFQVSVGLYPFLPNGDNYVFKYNPVTSFTLRVRAFSVSRPEFVSY